MSQASEAELLMLGLINQERTSRGLDPLKINNALNESSEDHSRWMLENDVFDHTGAEGSNPGDRIAATEYKLEGNWRTAENIGWQSERGEPGIADDVADIHESLMNSPGHRANILNPDLVDIGIGVETGDFQGYDGVMITQNFGRTDAVSPEPEEETPPVEVPEEETPDGETPEEEAPEEETPEEETPEEETPEEETPEEETPEEETPEEETPEEETPEEETPEEETPEEETPEPPVAEGPDDCDNEFSFDFAALFDQIFDQFDFAELSPMDDGADDFAFIFAFQGIIAIPESSMTEDNPADVDAMPMDVFTSCGGDMDFV